MVSPSSLSTILTVPCIAGCDGPICSSIGSNGNPSASPSSAPPFFDPSSPMIALLLGALRWLPSRRGGARRAGSDQRLTLLLGVVLAQRVSLELLVEVDASQIRVALELDAVHVVGLALEPVGTHPESDEARD